MEVERSSSLRTISFAFRNASMCGSHSIEIREAIPLSKSKPIPKSNRHKSKSRKQFDVKYANSYGACVSSLSSYRRKQSTTYKPSRVDIEQGIHKRVAECRRTLAEYNERLQSHEIQVNVPAFRVVKNLVLRDTEYKLRMGFNKWIRATKYLRHVEKLNILRRTTIKSITDDLVKQCIHVATCNVVSNKVEALTKQAALEEEEARKLAMTVQQWHRSRTQNKMNVLKGGSADGRKSVFMLPDALSKLQPISER